ncbi:DUF6249 domain-containing protein [Ulvibacter antarcticus]|uniref:DUF6249 domain-containing protein n=1 Tax=Ulvibacter antarcticus TaxID=442714 RepID=A0A3L9YTZ0_9FLAO|nr:DUF6249 domain-containing protein [Ulvibacter antarcticus]RMA57942.1 hypothetical protein BXY75_2749 [Ulvibacter antarcticus]
MEVLIVGIIFGVIFGIIYLFVSARNRERLALIEKGADASIFYGKDRKITPVWKVIVINLALLSMGIGLGIFIAGILDYSLGVEEEVAYPGTIFFMAGLGLFAGYYFTKKLNHDA